MSSERIELPVWEAWYVCSKTSRPYGLIYDKVIPNIWYHVSTDVLLPRQNIIKEIVDMLE